MIVKNYVQTRNVGAIIPASHDLSYDDILLTPNVSNIESRSECDTSTQLCCAQNPDIKHTFKAPIINSPMDSICSTNLYESLKASGALPCTNRSELQRLPLNFTDTAMRQVGINAQLSGHIICSVGTKNYESHIEAICTAYPQQRMFLLDIANGYSSVVEKPIKYMLQHIKHPIIIAGNVCDAAGFERLADLGCSAIRVGIGNGSVCTTRLATGVGRGQLSALLEIEQVRTMSYPHVSIIADGGLKQGGDIVKALAAGADFVMSGRLFAGCTECPLSIENETHSSSAGSAGSAGSATRKHLYRGQASDHYMQAHGIKKIGAEGTHTIVEETTSATHIIESLLMNIRSGMAYVGARNLKELREKAVGRMISSGTLLEGNVRF
tara:strand:- start:45232 stop:46374 length:1143 start_codon:yes stop_codon:yes gene_type:complete